MTGYGGEVKFICLEEKLGKKMKILETHFDEVFMILFVFNYMEFAADENNQEKLLKQVSNVMKLSWNKRTFFIMNIENNGEDEMISTDSISADELFEKVRINLKRILKSLRTISYLR